MSATLPRKDSRGEATQHRTRHVHQQKVILNPSNARRRGDAATLRQRNLLHRNIATSIRVFPRFYEKGAAMKALALRVSPASRFSRFWQIVRREAKRALKLHVEACGRMAELYQRSGR